MTKPAAKRLNAEQLDGRACVVCGETFRPMIPLGVETSTSSDVFRCEREECAVSPETAQQWIKKSKGNS